ncbi:MAG: nucleotidyltransferase family protein [Clostridia bacterium]|nr:nucleotidyltransferase family protein [Clostridia bacterium]
MNIGIICEYNPPHKGHAYQIAELKKRYPDCTVICVMSGNYVQRGTPAVADKYARAAAALAIGADAVVELPFPYSCAPAELFARAGISILSALGIDALCFGTEGDVLPALLTAAEQLDSPAFADALAKAAAASENRGIGYPVLRDRLYTERYGVAAAALLRTPNNTLAVEYLRAMHTLPTPITPIAIPRTGDAHDMPRTDAGVQDAIVSASAVRTCIQSGDFDAAMSLLPPTTADILRRDRAAGHLCTDPDSIPGPLLLHTFRTARPAALSRCAGLEGGLAGRLCDAAKRAHGTEEFYALAATKKYTNAAIRRAALYGFFGVTADMLRSAPAFTVLLAACDRAAPLLRRARKADALPVLSRPAAYKQLSDAAQSAFLLSLSADAVYGMLLPCPYSEAELLARTPTVLHGGT